MMACPFVLIGVVALFAVRSARKDMRAAAAADDAAPTA